MKAFDIVNHLARVIPKFSPSFSDSITPASIIPSGTTATVTFNGHDVIDGQIISVTGALAPVQIDVGTFLRVGTKATFDTLQDHDFTLSELDIRNGGKTLIISGANESEFNDTFNITRVVNRRQLEISVVDSGSTTMTGSALVENANGAIFNVASPAFNITVNTFDYTLPIAYTLPASGVPIVHTNIRIGAALDIDQYMTESYTKQTAGKDQLIVVLGDSTRNKRQREITDANDSVSGQTYYAPIFIQNFAVYIIQNTSDSLGAAEARDKTEFDYVPAVLRAIEGAQFATGFTYKNYRATCSGHGVHAYDNAISQGRAAYVHAMAFQQLAILDQDEDTFNEDTTVALRDFSYTLSTNLGTGVLTADVDVDDEPL